MIFRFICYSLRQNLAAGVFFRQTRWSLPHLLTVARIGHTFGIKINNYFCINTLCSSKQDENDYLQITGLEGIWGAKLQSSETLKSHGFLIGICTIIFPSLTSVSPLLKLISMQILLQEIQEMLNRKGAGLLLRLQTEQLHFYQFCKLRIHGRLLFK